MSVDTCKVLVYVCIYTYMSNTCKACKSKEHLDKNSLEYLRFMESHGPDCRKNHEGSSQCLEAAGVMELYQHSVERHNLCYTTFIGDGDSNAFSRVCKAEPYGAEHPVTKDECVGHVQKRMGTCLRRLTDRMKGKTIPKKWHFNCGFNQQNELRWTCVLFDISNAGIGIYEIWIWPLPCLEMLSHLGHQQAQHDFGFRHCLFPKFPCYQWFFQKLLLIIWHLTNEIWWFISRLRQNGRHFAEDTFTFFFLYENWYILNQISLSFLFFLMVPINNKQSLIKMMFSHLTDDKPLFETMMAYFINAYIAASLRVNLMLNQSRAFPMLLHFAEFPCV